MGERLNSETEEFETDVEFIRNQQQLMYELQSAEGLEWEREVNLLNHIHTFLSTLFPIQNYQFAA